MSRKSHSSPSRSCLLYTSESRLGDLKKRGVALREGQTLLDLYEERIPLYEKYADYTLECGRKSIRTIVEELAAGLAGILEK